MIYTIRSRSSKGLDHSPGRDTFGHIVGDYDAGHYDFQRKYFGRCFGKLCETRSS
ncbi:hypothetical protein M405DRAFT_830115, partial [Rhizopogon salebrosus TDB-379]